MTAKPVILCVQYGAFLLPTRPPCRFSYSATQEAVEPRATCWAESCLHPHRKRKVLQTDLKCLECHFLSLRYDGECCCVSGVAGCSEELEMQRDRGYPSAIPRVISAGETDLTQMKRVTRKGYGDETRKTDGKTNSPTTTNQHTTLFKCVMRGRHKMQWFFLFFVF